MDWLYKMTRKLPMKYSAATNTRSRLTEHLRAAPQKTVVWPPADDVMHGRSTSV